MLTPGEIDHFVERGHLPLRAAIPRELALACRDLALAQLGGADGPPWPGPVVRGPVLAPEVAEAAASPRLTTAIGELLAGERWAPTPNLGLFVVRYPGDVDPGDAGWHVDAGFVGPDTEDIFGWYVNHRSTGRGLLLLVLLSDVGPHDAPTRMLEGSHRAMPALLEPFGEAGVQGLLAPLPDPSGPIARATGEAGDVFLCHPFLVHAASWPHRGVGPRVMSQPAVAIEAGLRLDAPPGERSVVAAAISDC